MASLKYKILFLTLTPLALVLILIGGLTVYNKIETERTLLLNRLDAYRTLLESGDLTFETSADKAKLEALLNEKVEFSEIIDRKHQVLYSSENSAAPLFLSDQDIEDFDDAFMGIETTKNIAAREGRKTAFVIISPLIVNGRVVAVLHQGLSNEKSDQRTRDYILYIGIFVMVGIVLCFISISFLLDKALLKNIYKLKEATIEVQKGMLDTQTGVKTKDEIGDLASAFNQMTADLKKSREEIKMHADELEEQVGERTKELKSKNEELERFNKLAVGRELKMIELKKRIKELEEKRGERDEKK
ncbi:HAMP domain-containing protein [Candidatus Woesearchaeota archaeon]|nr:HAMP domain-containing protein [Candidatus Woesearchaeota archaeon]